MKEWLSEVIDQIALGEYLAKTSLSCGQRFGLIVVDNAVEFMLIGYIEIERRLVGGHIPGGIKRPDWEAAKGYFPQILSKVIQVEPKLAAHERDINNYHDLRGRLYHAGAPISVRAKYVSEYAKLARTVVSLLFGQSYTQEEWDSILSEVQALVCLEKPKGDKQEITYELVNGLVRFATRSMPKQIHAIALILHGFKQQTGETPSKESVLKSLSISGSDMKNDSLNARIHEMREKKWMERDSLVLTARGRKELLKPFIFL